jgi:hypothetical protein
VGSADCDDQVVAGCLPVPFFGDLAHPHLKIVTIGLNPALNEYNDYNGQPKNRSQRLALLADFDKNARADLQDTDVAEARERRMEYFIDPGRNWHSCFEKMDAVINRVDPGWSYLMGSAAHLDLVACATTKRWGKMTGNAQTHLIGNCRQYFLDSLSKLASGTVMLCDGRRVMQEMRNLGLPLEMQPPQLINIREAPNGDSGWIGKLILGDKALPIRGWSSQVSQLSAVWRFDLAFWLRGTFSNRAMPGFLFEVRPSPARS